MPSLLPALPGPTVETRPPAVAAGIPCYHAETWPSREVEHINPFLRSLERKSIIAGIKQVSDARAAVAAGVEIIFLLTGTIFDLKALVTELAGSDVLIFAHVDLLQGVGKDPQGMRFLAKEIGIDGMLSTRSHLIRAAKDEGLYTIQRFFLLDSEALKTAVNVLTKSKPDAVEILPALVLPNIRHRLPIAQLPPIIAGGLVETEEELQTVLRTPIKAVSTSRHALWSAHK